MAETILQLKNISKSFGVVKALKNVDLELKKGEVHALVGENGAGKSTLMKILTGVYTKDSGQIIYDGKEVEFSKPKDAMDAGISIVHQELNMMSDLTIAQNIFIGRETIKHKIFIDDRDIENKTRELFKLFNIEINPNLIVGDLTVGQQQMVEIVKAISMDAKIIIFDEPTAALTENEAENLFKIIDRLKKRGVTIVYITHRMDEIFQITDRITVLRDGEYVGTVETKKTTKDELIHMMVGRVIYINPKEKSEVEDDAEVVLEVKNMSRGRYVKNVSFKLRKGEILGISGLMGSGRTELARLIFGADKKDSGEIYVNGKKVEINSPYDAMKNSIAYLSEDRNRYGVITSLNVADNIALPSLENFTEVAGLINDKKIEDISNQYIKDLNIKTPSSKQIISNLSGGNRQKVVLAKWLARNCEILIIDEPTRGIDVGAKSEIYELMDRLTKEGKSIIMISSELPEILRMSDRVLVMCEGVKTAEIPIEEATQEKILHYATLRNGGMESAK